MGIIIKEALANGRLTERNEKTVFAGTMSVLKEQAERLSCTIDALVIAGLLARPWIDNVLSGAACVEHLDSNLKTIDVKWDNEAEEALAGLREPPSVYWETRKSLAWN